MGQRVRFWAGWTAVLLLAACSGAIRHSQTSPEAKDFHPRTIAVFPAETGIHEGSRNVLDEVIVRLLRDRKWFDRVADPAQVRQAQDAETDTRQLVADYLAKLNLVNFSDPDLSRRIGDRFQSQALLLTRVDRWDYGVEKEDKVARVALRMVIIRAEDGRILWTASHLASETYRWIQPALPDVAGRVAGLMIDNMPR